MNSGLLVCDGQTDICWDDLSEDDRSRYEHWLKGGFIRPAEDGERLMPLQEYRYYNARFKESVQWSITGKCPECGSFMYIYETKMVHAGSESKKFKYFRCPKCGYEKKSK